MPETLPECPFCGGAGHIYEDWPDCGKRATGFQVECAKCGGATAWYDTREQAIAAWTRRYYRLAGGSVYVIDPIGAGLANHYVIPKEET